MSEETITQEQYKRLYELTEELVDILREMNTIVKPVEDLVEGSSVCAETTIKEVDKVCSQLLDNIQEFVVE